MNLDASRTRTILELTKYSRLLTDAHSQSTETRRDNDLGLPNVTNEPPHRNRKTPV